MSIADMNVTVYSYGTVDPSWPKVCPVCAATGCKLDRAAAGSGLVLCRRCQREHHAAWDMIRHHLRTGEPLSNDEVGLILKSGLAATEDFGYVGGDLYRYAADDPTDPIDDPWQA